MACFKAQPHKLPEENQEITKNFVKTFGFRAEYRTWNIRNMK